MRKAWGVTVAALWICAGLARTSADLATFTFDNLAQGNEIYTGKIHAALQSAGHKYVVQLQTWPSLAFRWPRCRPGRWGHNQPATGSPPPDPFSYPHHISAPTTHSPNLPAVALFGFCRSDFRTVYDTSPANITMPCWPAPDYIRADTNMGLCALFPADGGNGQYLITNGGCWVVKSG